MNIFKFWSNNQIYTFKFRWKRWYVYQQHKTRWIKKKIDLKKYKTKSIKLKLKFSNDYDLICENLFKGIKVIRKITFNNFNLCKNMNYMFSG